MQLITTLKRPNLGTSSSIVHDLIMDTHHTWYLLLTCVTTLYSSVDSRSRTLLVVFQRTTAGPTLMIFIASYLELPYRAQSALLQSFLV